MRARRDVEELQLGFFSTMPATFGFTRFIRWIEPASSALCLATGSLMPRISTVST